MLFRNLALFALAASVSAVSSTQEIGDVEQVGEVAQVSDAVDSADSADAGETTIMLTIMSTSTNYITATDAATTSTDSPDSAIPTPDPESPASDASASPTGDTNIMPKPTGSVDDRLDPPPSPAPSAGFGLPPYANSTKPSKCRPSGTFPLPGDNSTSTLPAPEMPPYPNATLPDSGDAAPYPTATLPKIPGTTGTPKAPEETPDAPSECPAPKDGAGEGTWIGSCDGSAAKGGVKMLPDSANCDVYWVCDHNKPRKMSCAPGTEFMVADHRCDFPRDGGCKAKGSKPRM
jgi:hypothetical protein